MKSRKKRGDVIHANSLYRQNKLTQLTAEISDESESISSEENTDGRFESGDFDISKDDFLCGYAGEPEYNKEELKSMEFSDDTKRDSNEEETDLNPSRQENLHWCKCSDCTVMPTFIECRCCKKFKNLLDDELSSGCITNHEAIDTLILSKSDLEIAFIVANFSNILNGRSNTHLKCLPKGPPLLVARRHF